MATTRLSKLSKNQRLQVGSEVKSKDHRVKHALYVQRIDDNGDYGTYVYLSKDMDSKENTAYGIEEMFRLYDLVDE
jgi:hypothetical protein